jgi:hypothetical protein
MRQRHFACRESCWRSALCFGICHQDIGEVERSRSPVVGRSSCLEWQAIPVRVPVASLEGSNEAQADKHQVDRERDLHLTLMHLMREADAIAHGQQAQRR